MNNEGKQELKYDELVNSLAWMKVNNPDNYKNMLETYVKLLLIAKQDVTREQFINDIEEKSKTIKPSINFDEILKEMEKEIPEEERVTE